MTESPDPVHGIDRSIYGMPAFTTLAVADLDRTVAWFTGALDFIELFRLPPTGTPALVHLRRWRYQDVLVRPAQDDILTAPGGAVLSFAADVTELDALAERARRFGDGTVEGPLDTAWNTRDLVATSPDGVTVVLTALRPLPERDARFEADMRDWSAAQGLLAPE